DPMRLLLVEGRSYLEGWCRRAEAVRLFRLDRVVDLSVLDQPARVPEDAESIDVDQGLFRPSPGDTLVTLEVGRAGRWVADYYTCENVEELPDDRLRVQLRTSDLRLTRRLALRLGDAGRVIAPPELVDAVRGDAERALAAYDSGPAPAGDRRPDRPHVRHDR